MTDTLVVAISQSGTTTDTNRTVDLVRGTGAAVIGIVNRRQSDLVDKSDGVLYTSDGRDLEMSVASTKAFYAQIAAGFLLAFAIAAELGAGTRTERDRTRPPRDPRRAAGAARPRCATCSSGARRSRSPRSGTRSSRRSWAVVGNGVNRVAAEEIRIKLSELCYKSISCDITEDKKHIDLSAEPMILVCAAGLHGSNADDVGKEIAIYRAHKSAPIVIADDGEARFLAALETLTRAGRAPRCLVRAVHDGRAPVRLRGRARHRRDGAPAARGTRLHRSARSVLRARATSSSARSPVELQPHADRFFDGLRTSSYDGALDAGTAVRLASLLRYATGVVPLDVYQVEFGKVGTPSTVIEDLNARAHEGDRGADAHRSTRSSTRRRP